MALLCRLPASLRWQRAVWAALLGVAAAYTIALACWRGAHRLGLLERHRSSGDEPNVATQSLLQPLEHVPVVLARGRFQSASSPAGFHVRAEGLDATMQAVVAFCRGAPSGPSVADGEAAGKQPPAMVTRHFAAWDTGGVDGSRSVNTTALYLETCFPIEIAVNYDNSIGHCSDFAQYVYHSGARLSRLFPPAVLEEKVRRCPHSTYLHGQFPVRELMMGTERAPAAARNFWLPNLEWILVREAELVPHTHTFLAKTRVTARALTDYLAKHGLAGAGASSGKGPRVWYAGHSSPDPMPSVGEMAYAKDYGSFLHAYGKSYWKHMYEIIECWLQHPDWPQLDVIGMMSEEQLAKDHAPALARLAARFPGDARFNGTTPFPPNLRIRGTMTPADFNLLAASRGVHLCPSSQEGYGHYINVARALGALVVTTDHPPMNEFVADGTSGVLVRGHGQLKPERHKLIEDVFTPYMVLTPQDVCVAVERVLALPVADRAAMGRVARAAYEHDTASMVEQLAAVLVESVEALSDKSATSATAVPGRPTVADLRRAWRAVFDLEAELIEKVQAMT
ncbi:hypothetical protein HK405_008782 [Cladochytrium tenue]|nr:hypothetical protein HK405_008782 [Cladochytrium tenue]